MKSRQFDLLLTVAMMTGISVIFTAANPIPLEDSMIPRRQMNEIYDRKSNPERIAVRIQKIGSTCLRVAPDLPPCNFDAQATWRSTNDEVFHGNSGSTYHTETLPKFFTDENIEQMTRTDAGEENDDAMISTRRKILNEFNVYQNDFNTMIVYYLEGCLPSRLPFDLPPCPTEELQTIQMNKLVPFKLPDIEDALIFPEIDVKQIEFFHRQSHAQGAAYPSSHEDIWEKVNTGNEDGDMFKKSQTLRGQEFHKIMAKNSIRPRTGIASTKYVRKSESAGQAMSISSTNPSPAVKNMKKSVRVATVNGEGVEALVAKDKNRVH